ncbi:MAG: DHH family phosphoesterase [Aquificaceae bacterium]|nr:DHH family phosphoesterase [Aquificaceae bacterium]
MKGISEREWVILSEHVKPERAVVESSGYIKAQLLANRQASHDALKSHLKDLLPPYDIPNIRRAVELVADYVRKGRRIVLFGDYDADGITGTAILYQILKSAGSRVLPLLPSRKRGYGLTKELAIKIGRYADLLITVDNGTNAVEELSLLNIPVVVLDHHNPSDMLPPAIIVNPKLDSNSLKEFKGLSSSGLAFYLSALLKRELELDLDVREYLHLACIGTVADVMPMNFLNRIIVSNGIRLLNHILKGGHGTPGLRLLMERSGMREVSSRDVAFYIAPRLNAPGRVAKPYTSLKLLIERDEKRASELVERIHQLNQFRKHLSQNAFEEALRQSQAQKNENLVVVKLEDWAGGVAGIVAGKLSSLLEKPTVVLAIGKEHTIASSRAPEGIDLYQTLKPISHLFLRWGGHPSAVGFTIESQKIELFERLATELFSNAQRMESKLYIDMPIPLSKIDRSLYNLIGELEPYGEGFPEPVFVSEPLELRLLEHGVDRMVLKAGDFMVVSWESSTNKRLKFPIKGKRVAYQIDRRGFKRITLVDVEV